MAMHDPEMDRQTSPRRLHRMMVALVAVAIVIAVTDVVVSVGTGGFEADDLLGILGVLGFVGTGAPVRDRRPSEPVGRICVAMGLLFGLGDTFRLTIILVDDQRGPLPPPAWVMVVIASILISMAILLGGP